MFRDHAIIGIAARIGAEIVLVESDRSGLSINRTLKDLPEYFPFLISCQIATFVAGYISSIFLIFLVSRSIVSPGRIGIVTRVSIAIVCGLAVGLAIEFYMYYATGR